VSDAARLRWFVNFAQPGPRRPTSRAEQRLIGKLRDYVRDVGLRRDGRGQDTNPFTLPLRPEEDHKSVAEKLALVQSTIRTLLRQHLSHGKRRPEANVALRLTVSEDGDVSRQIETDDLRDAVAYVLLLELAQFGRRVRRCTNPACQRFFVRERRQRYCSVICRNRATFKRWYRRHVGLMSRDSGKTAIVMRHRTAHKRARATRRLVA
jgi:hypothetical protein